MFTAEYQPKGPQWGLTIALGVIAAFAYWSLILNG